MRLLAVFDSRTDRLEMGCEGKTQVKTCGLSAWKDGDLGGRSSFGG